MHPREITNCIPVEIPHQAPGSDLVPPSQFRAMDLRVMAVAAMTSSAPKERRELRARQEIRCTFCCWPPGPLARRERRAYPLRYVRSEQHSQRACGPQPGGARRRAGICGVAAPRRCHHIACVAAPCICPPGARAKMHTLFSDGPLARGECFLRTPGTGATLRPRPGRGRRTG